MSSMTNIRRFRTFRGKPFSRNQIEPLALARRASIMKPNLSPLARAVSEPAVICGAIDDSAGNRQGDYRPGTGGAFD
jgi:hypothetical protein